MVRYVDTYDFGVGFWLGVWYAVPRLRSCFLLTNAQSVPKQLVVVKSTNVPNVDLGCKTATSRKKGRASCPPPVAPNMLGWVGVRYNVHTRQELLYCATYTYFSSQTDKNTENFFEPAIRHLSSSYLESSWLGPKSRHHSLAIHTVFNCY